MVKVDLVFMPRARRWRILIDGKAIPRRYSDRATAKKEFEKHKAKAEGKERIDKHDIRT